MNIGEFAAMSGTPARSLRYYEEQDLIRPDRLPNGYRDYDPELVERVVTADAHGASAGVAAVRCGCGARPRTAEPALSYPAVA